MWRLRIIAILPAPEPSSFDCPGKRQGRLGSVDVGMVPLRVDERFHCVLRSSAGDEFAISAPPSRMARHPDVNGEASEHSETALEVSRLLWILRCGQPPQVARAHDVQHAITGTNVERP